MVFYLNIDVKTLIGRVLESRGMDFWESGMDLKHGDDIYDSFRTYQNRLLKEYASMARRVPLPRRSTPAGRSTGSRTSCAGRWARPNPPNAALIPPPTLLRGAGSRASSAIRSFVRRPRRDAKAGRRLKTLGGAEKHTPSSRAQAE